MFIARRCLEGLRPFHNPNLHLHARAKIQSYAHGILSCPISLSPKLRNYLPLAQNFLQQRSYCLPKKTNCHAFSTKKSEKYINDKDSSAKTYVAKESSKKSRITVWNLWNQYGVVFLGTYLGVYCVTLSSLFLLLNFGLVGEERANQIVVDVAEYFDWSDLNQVDPDSWHAWIFNMNANLPIAWILTKFTEPLRLATAVAITPTFARLLKREQNTKI